MKPENEESQEAVPGGQLYFLSHPGSEMFSGYGLTTRDGRPDRLVGLLMVDRPRPADPAWLDEVAKTYGECVLVSMTQSGERGLLTQMRIDVDSVPYLHQAPNSIEASFTQALQPLLESPPAPVLKLGWDGERHLWHSRFWFGLPPHLQEVFERCGYGCFSIMREGTVGFVTYLPIVDIGGFRNAPVLSHWELVEMSTAPLIRFRAAIFDDPDEPYVLERFLNVQDPEQASCLAQLVKQEELIFDFFGEEYEYAYSKHMPHPEGMRRDLDTIVRLASEHYEEIPAGQHDFDQAKLEFQRRFAI